MVLLCIDLAEDILEDDLGLLSREAGTNSSDSGGGVGSLLLLVMRGYEWDMVRI